MIIPFFNMQENARPDSYVKLPSATVNKMCRVTLKAIKKAKAEALQRMIEVEREAIVSGWWHRLMKRPAPTDEEIMKILETGSGGDSFCPPRTLFLELRYSKQTDIANKLLRASEVADELFIATEELLWIQ